MAVTLRKFLTLPGLVVFELTEVIEALLRFESISFDWVDALLLAYTRRAVVFTFVNAV